MPMIKVGKNHFNSDRIINVITPASDGVQHNGVKLVLAGTADEFLFGEEADAIREWLDAQGQTTHEAELAKLRTNPAKPAIVTKAPSKPA